MSDAFAGFFTVFKGAPFGDTGLLDCRDGVIEGVTFSGRAADDGGAMVIVFEGLNLQTQSTTEG